MSAIELYEQTLEQYKAALTAGRNVSLTVFCKEHHVNGRAMNKWMGSRGIHVNALRKQLLPSSAARLTQDRPASLFAEIGSPVPTLSPETIHDVSIELPSGVKANIGLCDVSALGGLLVQLSEIPSCSH